MARDEHVDLEAALAAMGPGQRDSLAQAGERFARLSAEEQDAARAAMRREVLEQQADQVVEAALDAARTGRSSKLLPRLAEMAAYFAEGEHADPAHVDLACFIQAVAAVLQGEEPRAVASDYVTRLAEVAGAAEG